MGGGREGMEVEGGGQKVDGINTAAYLRTFGLLYPASIRKLRDRIATISAGFSIISQDLDIPLQLHPNYSSTRDIRTSY